MSKDGTDDLFHKWKAKEECEVELGAGDLQEAAWFSIQTFIEVNRTMKIRQFRLIDRTILSWSQRLGLLIFKMGTVLKQNVQKAKVNVHQTYPQGHYTN